jgi:hypothetical protein
MRVIPICYASAILFLIGCVPAVQKAEMQKLIHEGRSFEPATEVTITTGFRNGWLGDSAHIMSPYTMIAVDPQSLNTQLHLGLDDLARSEIAFAWKDAQQGLTIGQQGYILSSPWKGKALFAAGTCSRAVAHVPVQSKGMLLPTDSTFIPLHQDLHDAQDGRMMAYRKFEFGGRPGLLVSYTRKCDADLDFPSYTYLFYDRQGMLRAIVYLEDPCTENRSLMYARYEWDDQLYLQKIHQWTLSESQEAEETQVIVETYAW